MTIYTISKKVTITKFILIKGIKKIKTFGIKNFSKNTDNTII